MAGSDTFLKGAIDPFVPHSLPILDLTNQGQDALEGVLRGDYNFAVKTGAYLGFRVVNILSIPANILSFVFSVLASIPTCCCTMYFPNRARDSVKRLGTDITNFPVVFEIRMLVEWAKAPKTEKSVKIL